MWEQEGRRVSTRVSGKFLCTYQQQQDQSVLRHLILSIKSLAFTDFSFYSHNFVFTNGCMCFLCRKNLQLTRQNKKLCGCKLRV